MNIDIGGLTRFLHAASMPHAHGTSNAKKMPDKSTTITFAQGVWFFHDNFFGGQPYGGRAIIFYRSRPVWIMVYYGQVHDTGLKSDEVYNFLRTALQHVPQEKPYRGPDRFTAGTLEYRNHISGNMTNYSGREIILENDKEVYWASYRGGLVDQEAGVGF